MGFLKTLDQRVFMRWQFIPYPDTGRWSRVQEWLRGTIRDPAQHFEAATSRECPCCGYSGRFVSAGQRKHREHRCPNCKSRPRDRFLALLIAEYGIELERKRVLHFAPEWPLYNRLRRSETYVGADIKPRRNANAILDITHIDAPDHSFDVIICNHVLEHVPDDRRAMKECRRVLARNGTAFFSVPIDTTMPHTWEPPPDMPEAEVEAKCGEDHKRLYGQDLVSRLAEAGFECDCRRPEPDQIERYRLLPADVFFVCRRQK